MIPKIIHYCWFGRKPKQSSFKRYLKTWQSILYDYKIIEWNEDNSNLDCCQFCRDAYNNNRFAYVSDVIRLKALYEYGGIYLDTDVEIVSSFDKYLNLKAFLSFENENLIGTGVIGAEKGSLFIRDFLDVYKSKEFVNDTRDQMQTNTIIARSILIKKGVLFDNTRKSINNYIDIFPSDFFSAKNSQTGVLNITENTCSIHHFAASWFTPRQQFNYRVSIILHKLGLWNLFLLLKERKLVK